MRVTVTLAHLLPRHPHQDLYSHLVYLPKCSLFFSHMRPPLSWVIDAGDEPLPIQRTVVTDTLSSKEWHMSNTYILTKTGKEQGGGGGSFAYLSLLVSNQSMSKAFSLETPTVVVKSSDSEERLLVFKS